MKSEIDEKRLKITEEYLFGELINEEGLLIGEKLCQYDLIAVPILEFEITEHYKRISNAFEIIGANYVIVFDVEIGWKNKAHIFRYQKTYNIFECPSDDVFAYISDRFALDHVVVTDNLGFIMLHAGTTYSVIAASELLMRRLFNSNPRVLINKFIRHVHADSGIRTSKANERLLNMARYYLNQFSDSQ